MPTESHSQHERQLERNLELYAWYVPLSRGYFWAPVFFLFLSARFELDQILELHAFYYLCVVVLEVPSGYLSDRVGRCTTLRISAGAGVVAYSLFALGSDTYALYFLAQFAQAVFFSFLSGTDASFHFDSLVGLERGEEFAHREARLGRNGFLAGALCAVTGGAVGVFDLRYAYFLSLAGALALSVVCWAMREPPRDPAGWAHERFSQQLRACLGLLRTPLLAWILFYVVLQVTLEHIPYEFAQPYVAFVLGESAENVRDTPLLTGLVAASIAGVGALASARSLWLRDRLGSGGALLAVAGLQTLLIALMGTVVSVAVLPLIAVRSVQGAVARVIVNAAVAPRVPQALRATYLSLQSLVGRLSYAGVLLGLSALVGEAATDRESLAMSLRVSALLGVVGLLVLAWTSRSSRWADPKEVDP